MKIIVEGQTDRDFISRYMQYLGLNIDEKNIIKCDGKTNLKLIKDLSKDDEKKS